ncbi:hypothetical protein OIU84_001304 [Salix udensis]|uniref:Uncharacterized protein n=1 Tax=Salix udensis TaxID=889485 RepID=A0AAD6K6J1_9ROSI|nr:hypothetical protein OIU84_001304 [Salix udensis]
MASLHQMLSEEGFEHRKFLRSRDRLVRQDESVKLPIHIFHDQKRLQFPNQKTDMGSTRKRVVGIFVEESEFGYGRYIKDVIFREMIREKCSSCLVRRSLGSDDGIFVNMVLGMETIEKVVEEKATGKEVKMESLKKSIQLLSNVASLNSKKSRKGSTCGVPNSHLSAYLWEHFLLPHLLHLKVWYHDELEVLSDSHHFKKEIRMKALSKAYNEQMDKGTIQFALYYKEWIKVGDKAPSVPAVPFPSGPSYAPSMRRSSGSFNSRSSTVNKNLYRAVFGPTKEFDSRNRASMDTWSREEDNVCIDEYKDFSYATNNKARSSRRLSSQNHVILNHDIWHEPPKSELLRLFSCRSVSSECLVNRNIIVRSNSIRNVETTHLLPIDLSRAISTICSSDSLTDCETAIRVTAKAWLDSNGSNVIEGALSKAPVIEGLLEILLASTDDEVQELAISILAELVPKAKQMISIDWVALVLRVLEFGGQLQTLFTVRCLPEKAAMYFLGQLLTGFDEDKNLENASQVVALGGLSFLVRTFEIGDITERNHASTLLSCCIRANGSSRNYIAENLNKDSLLQLIVLGIQKKFKGCVFTLLADLLCLSRRTRISKFLTGLSTGWGGLNTMHIFLVYLQRASPEERPLAATVLLQLDLMGDLSHSSLYREEAVEAITESLECHNCSTKVSTRDYRDHFRREEIVDGNLDEEEDAVEDWQRKVAVVLLNSGGKRALDGRMNPSFSQKHLIRSSEALSMLSTLNKELIDPLRNPS